MAVLAFQSTPPMRGATSYKGGYCYCAPISIHAPHAGSDTNQSLRMWLYWYFNPRPPCGERPDRRCVTYIITLISIHAPHAGSDGYPTPLRTLNEISIHAPHAGSDSTLPFVRLTLFDFNPRPPCGERHTKYLKGDGWVFISIHAPHAGSDIDKKIYGFWDLISIHAPHAGSDGRKNDKI